MNDVAWSNQIWRNGISTECHCIKYSSCSRRRLGYYCICTISHHLLSYLQSRVPATSQTWAWWIPGNISWGTHQVQSFGYTAFLECRNVRYVSFHNWWIIVLIPPLEMKLSVFNPLSHLVYSVHPQWGVAARHWVLTCMNILLPQLDELILL